MHYLVPKPSTQNDSKVFQIPVRGRYSLPIHTQLKKDIEKEKEILTKGCIFYTQSFVIFPH